MAVEAPTGVRMGPASRWNGHVIPGTDSAYDDAGTTRTAYYVNNPQRIDEQFKVTVLVGGVPTKVYPLTDALGSVYGVTNQAGALISTFSFDVYGARSQTSGTVALRWGFTGREHDPDTGRIHHGVRDHDPRFGGWSQADPAGMVDGPNLYSYVNQRPTMATDPSGMAGTLVVAGLMDNRFKMGSETIRVGPSNLASYTDAIANAAVSAMAQQSQPRPGQYTSSLRAEFAGGRNDLLNLGALYMSDYNRFDDVYLVGHQYAGMTDSMLMYYGVNKAGNLASGGPLSLSDIAIFFEMVAPNRRAFVVSCSSTSIAKQLSSGIMVPFVGMAGFFEYSVTSVDKSPPYSADYPKINEMMIDAVPFVYQGGRGGP